MSYKGMKLKAQFIEREVDEIEYYIERKERVLSIVDQFSPEIFETFEVYGGSTIEIKSKEDLTKVRRLLKESFGRWSDEFGTLSHYYGDKMIASWHGTDDMKDVRIVLVEEVKDIDLEWYGMPDCRIKKNDVEAYRARYEVSCDVSDPKEETGVRLADED